MITAKLSTTSTGSPAEPPISFPFLWRSKNSGRTYLRYVSRADAGAKPHLAAFMADILVVGIAHDSTFDIGTATTTSVTDHEAWERRLKPDEIVTLANK